MALEMTADENTDGRYDIAWSRETPIRIDFRPIIRGVVTDAARGIDPAMISAKFHAALIHLFTDLAQTLGRQTGLKRIALSGGVFQNRILTRGLTQSLAAKGFEVLTHAQVPCNDGGISLGQAVAAAALLEKGSP